MTMRRFILRFFRFLVRVAVPSMRSLRLACYSLVVFGVLALISGRAVYADMTQVGMGMGHELAKLEDLTGGAYLVRVNGAEVHWASARTNQSVEAVLNRYEEYCRKSPSMLGTVMHDVPSALEGQVALKKNDPARSAIVREASADRGMVACFVDENAAAEGTTPERLRLQLQAFAATGDIAALGRFRYVFAERGKNGATRVVTIWADGSLNIGRMFPAEGDAPGTDSSIAPRPIGSRRTMSASIEGFPAAVRGYETKESHAAVLAQFDAGLREAGLTRVDGIDSAKGAAAWLREDGTEIILSLSSAGEGRTSVGIVESHTSIQGIKVEKK